jgi:hypothetical protein
MNRQSLIDYLRDAERYVMLGEERIERQRETVAETERVGDEVATAAARDLLKGYETLLEECVAHQKRLTDELAIFNYD